ncbi:DUF2513 domain-containing protein [Paraburkholderia elongata]|nr:DUF2513 domain-containing protein [Paraburkholderia elongata]
MDLRGSRRATLFAELCESAKSRAASHTRYDCADVVPVAPFRRMSYRRQEEIVKRDMNLALAILKILEENKSPHLSEFDIESALKDAFDVSNRGVWYQLNLLADANLVRSMGSDWRLTWDGHEFLKSAVPNTFEDT